MQAGRHWLFRLVAARQIGASGPRFPSLFDVGSRNFKSGYACRRSRWRALGRGFDSRRLHHFSSMNMGLRALRSRRLHYFSTAVRVISVPVSNNRIAASRAAGLRCIYC